MLEILKYIFSSFWIFIGFVIILCLILEVISISINNILRTIMTVSKNKSDRKTKGIKEDSKNDIGKEN